MRLTQSLSLPTLLSLQQLPLLLLPLLLLLLCCGNSECSRTPVILIPGDGGSQLEAKLDGKSQVPHYWCASETKDYYPIWLNVELLTYFAIDCFIDNFRLVFDQQTKRSHSAPNVSIRAPSFGDTKSVEYFDVSRISPSAYFNTLVAALVSAGYQRNVSVHGAPFDFRLGPNELQEFFANLRQLIEATVVANDNKPALLAAHSYGNVLTLKFLQQQSPSWKQRYVRAMLAIAPPIGGAVKTLRLLSSGDSLNIPFERPLTIRPVQRSFTSSAFLTPMSPFWSNDEVIISQPARNYTVADYADFFKDIGFPLGQQMREASVGAYDPHTPPGVEVHCVHGDGLPTPGRFLWLRDWPDRQPDIVFDDGDGTVNIRSLLACQLWRDKQKQPVHNLTIHGAEHLQILHHPELANYTLQLLHSFGNELTGTNDLLMQQQQQQQQQQQRQRQQQQQQSQILRPQLFQQQQQIQQSINNDDHL